MFPLIEQCVDAKYNTLFRAIPSMYAVILLAVQNHDYNHDPYVSVAVTEDSQIEMRYHERNRVGVQTRTMRLREPVSTFPKKP